MAILKTRCPECNAGLKSPTGFAVGQTVCCPKCETYFSVEEPAEEAEDEAPKKASTTASKGKAKDAPTAKKPLKASAAGDDEPDDEDDSPKQKKKKKQASYDEDEEGTRSYKNSPLRFAVLGVLVVIMLVLGYFLYEKRKREREDTASAPTGGGTVEPTPVGPPAPRPGPRPNQGGKQGNVVPGGGGGPVIPFGLAGSPALTPAELQKRTDAFKAKLVGTWVADLGGGATEELTYNADGTFTTRQTGPKEGTSAGKYTIKELVGTKGVKIQQDAGGATRTVTAIFEDDELQHPTLQAGVTGTFRKK